MFKILRIIAAVAAALLIAAAVFVGIFIGWIPFLGCAAGALLLFALSLLFKYLQETHEPPPPEDEGSGKDQTNND